MYGLTAPAPQRREAQPGRAHLGHASAPAFTPPFGTTRTGVSVAATAGFGATGSGFGFST
ncbi:hypothetical protein [Streptomyces sp. AB3(2024)]|uniref:hypothetical protein n=1 Tax=Streptomyces sp. AB3(2024) TaxID=3317321 RepID=UPI0035A3669B